MTFYITTAIDYPSGKPHIGHAYEKIVADAIARWNRLKGEDVYFLTGTDEHGLKMHKKAKEAGKETQAYVDEMSEYFRELCGKLQCTNDDFIRTTEARHKKGVHVLYEKMKTQGDFYKGTYSGLYCVDCENYYTESNAENNHCPVHKTLLQKLSEESYFFKLSKYQKPLLEHFKNNPEFITPKHRMKEITNRLEKELLDLSISRTSFDWGVTLPDDDAHVLYVWLDALSNYITALDFPNGENYKKYWPANLHVIGKDILWFHSVLWPAFLLSAGVALPKQILAHGFVNTEGEKMSKSLGNVIDPIALIDSYSSDALRYFLLREGSLGEDLNFTEKALITRLNSELADAFGNLLSRNNAMIFKYFKGTIPLSKPDPILEEKARNTIQNASKHFDDLQFNKALEVIFAFIDSCNAFIAEKQPWKLAKEEKQDELASVLYSVTESLRIAGILLFPIIPTASIELRKQLGLQAEFNLKETETFVFIKENTKIGEGKYLFKKIEET
jgi:methionyl-tRNA synthetase